MAEALCVGVNLLWCLPGAVGGSEEYLVRQLVGLRASDPDLALRLAVLPGFAAAHPRLAGSGRDAAVEVVEASLDAQRRSRRVLTEVTWLPSQMRGLDVVHHGGGTVPLRSPGPVVVTIHDVQYLHHPEYVSPLKLRYLRLAVPSAVRRAAVVAVPSEFVRTTVLDAFSSSADPDRVVVVPHGLDVPADVAGETDLRRRYDLGDRPFVVYPAVTHPHKQHRFLLQLMAGGCGRWSDPDLLLVAIGGSGLAEDEVAGTVDALGLADRVRRPGRVSDADRDGLVAAADAVVFPSQYEGFGAPVLEAMALGTPVVATDATALPDVVGDAGLVLPLEPAAWSDALDEVERRRDELVAAGRRRAATFSLRRSGAALATAYRLAAAR